MNKRDRAEIVFGALALAAWFGLPITKMLVFVATGHKWFGPAITANDDPTWPNDLGLRLILLGVILAIPAIACAISNSDNR